MIKKVFFLLLLLMIFSSQSIQMQDHVCATLCNDEQAESLEATVICPGVDTYTTILAPHSKIEYSANSKPSLCSFGFRVASNDTQNYVWKRGQDTCDNNCCAVSLVGGNSKFVYFYRGTKCLYESARSPEELVQNYAASNIFMIAGFSIFGLLFIIWFVRHCHKWCFQDLRVVPV